VTLSKNCVHPVRRKRVPTPPTPGGVAGLAARYPRRSADPAPVAHYCCHAPPREGGAEGGSAGKEIAGTAPSLARPRPISSIGTREGCLLAPAGTEGHEMVPAAAAARAGNAGREASGC